MQPALIIILAAGAIALHFWWRRRYGRVLEEIEQRDQRLAELRGRGEAMSNQREAQLEVVFNSMAEGVLVLDENDRIQLLNQAARQLFDLSQEVRGRTILEAFRLQELDQLRQRLRGGEPVEGCELELPGLSSRWVQVSAAAIADRNGAKHGACFIFHDLTRIKHLENTRQEFVANVSHELRTPLSLIKGYVETLLGGAKDNPEAAARFLQIIEKHTARLTYLIEDLLTLSRVERGQISMNLGAIKLREEVQRAVEDLKSRALERSVVVENQVPENLVARADADRLQQVLFNLIENAIKYGRSPGKVSVGGQESPERRAEVWVQDDGPGIPAEAQQRVFERFYRVDKARSRETGGTGLGLAIVKHILQAHGGEVWVKSEPGHGSTFHFTLPRD